MDYLDAFKHLRTNNKYGRKSPHKAVMMLTVIELYEQNVLSDNEIYFNDSLKKMFLRVWNKVLPDEMFFQSEAYLPFWYLQSDLFWHIVPNRGKEDVLSLMRDTHVKPSEAIIQDSVKYAELDEDLYFLMTLPSGRSSLKRILLENYTTLTKSQIDSLAQSVDNTIDYSVSALSDYEKILSQEERGIKEQNGIINNEIINQFQELSEDIQIELNFQYYSFMKEHRNEREMFKDVFPTVYDLFDKIVNHPVKQGDYTPLFSFTYDNFLSDLKISLMSEDGSMEIIDSINECIDYLRGNKRGNSSVIEPIEEAFSVKHEDYTILPVISESPSDLIEIEEKSLHEIADGNIAVRGESLSDITPESSYVYEDKKGTRWTHDEEEQIETLYHRGVDFATIAEKLGRTDVAIKCRLAKLGLIDYTYGEDEPISEDQIEHVYLNEKGETIRKEMGGDNAEMEEVDVKEDENEIEEEKSQVRRGTRVRLLPSQIEGVVVNHITTKSGEKRIVIQKDDGSIFSALDHPYLYEKVRKRRRRIGESRMKNDIQETNKHRDNEPNRKSSIKEQFRSYLAWRKPDSTANGYTSTLDNPVRRWINAEVDEQADSIFSYTTSEDVRLCIDLLKASPGFSAENARQHNRMSAALSQYLLFIEDRESKTKK